MPKPKVVDLFNNAQDVPAEEMAAVASVFREKGRVAGAEALRDLVLKHWRAFHLPAQVAVKLVLETDRHALMAQMAALKTEGAQGAAAWHQFQRFMEGKINSFDEERQEKPDVPEEKENA